MGCTCLSSRFPEFPISEINTSSGGLPNCTSLPRHLEASGDVDRVLAATDLEIMLSLCLKATKPQRLDQNFDVRCI
jgi:hypothetical protein